MKNSDEFENGIYLDTDEELWKSIDDLYVGQEVIPKYRSLPLVVTREVYIHKPPRSANKYRSIKLEGNGCKYRMSTLKEHHGRYNSPWLSIKKENGDWEKKENILGMHINAGKIIIRGIDLDKELPDQDPKPLGEKYED